MGLQFYHVQSLAPGKFQNQEIEESNIFLYIFLLRMIFLYLRRQSISHFENIKNHNNNHSKVPTLFIKLWNENVLHDKETLPNPERNCPCTGKFEFFFQ